MDSSSSESSECIVKQRKTKIVTLNLSSSTEDEGKERVKPSLHKIDQHKDDDQVQILTRKKKILNRFLSSDSEDDSYHHISNSTQPIRKSLRLREWQSNCLQSVNETTSIHQNEPLVKEQSHTTKQANQLVSEDNLDDERENVNIADDNNDAPWTHTKKMRRTLCLSSDSGSEKTDNISNRKPVCKYSLLEEKRLFKLNQGIDANKSKELLPPNKKIRESVRLKAKANNKTPLQLNRKKFSECVSDNMSSDENERALKQLTSSLKKKREGYNFIYERSRYNEDISFNVYDNVYEKDFIDDESDNSDKSERKKKVKRKRKKSNKNEHASSKRKLFLESDDSNVEHESAKVYFEDTNEGNDNQDINNDYVSCRSRREKRESNFSKELKKLKRKRADKKLSVHQSVSDSSSGSEIAPVKESYFEEDRENSSDEAFIDDDSYGDHSDGSNKDHSWTAIAQNILINIHDKPSSEESHILEKNCLKSYRRIKSVCDDIYHGDSDSDNKSSQNLTTKEKELFQYVLANNVEAVKSFTGLSNYTGLLYKEKLTALHIASMNGFPEMIEVLINHGANTCTVDGLNLLPISYTVLHKFPMCFDYLLKHTNITYACRHTRKHCNGSNLMHLLLTIPKDVDSFKEMEKNILECVKIYQCYNKKAFRRHALEANDKRLTPFIMAIINDQPMVVKIILDVVFEKELDSPLIEFPNNEGETFLHFVVQHSSRCLAEIIPFFIGDINAKDLNGFTPLMYAAELGKDECLEILLNFNASITHTDKEDTTPLHLAAANGNLKSVEILLDSGHPVDCVDQYGWPPLLYANFQATQSCVIKLFNADPLQIFCLSQLLHNEDPIQRNKNTKVIQDTLMSISHIDAYYTLFNDFIGNHLSLLDKNNVGLFTKTWRMILSFENKVKWLRSKHDMAKWHVTYINVDRENVLECAVNRLSNLQINGLNVKFNKEEGSCLGPKREFFDSLIKDITNDDKKLLKRNENHHYSLMPRSYFLDHVKKTIKPSKLTRNWNESRSNKQDASQSSPLLSSDRVCFVNSKDIDEMSDVDLVAAAITLEQLNKPAKDLTDKYFQQDENTDALLKMVDEKLLGVVKTRNVARRKTYGDYRMEYKQYLKKIKFIGKLVSEVILSDEINITMELSKPLIKQLLGIPLLHPEELKEVEHQFLTNIMENNINDLELPFLHSVVNPWNGNLEEVMLGKSMNAMITDENKGEYLNCVSVFQFETSVAKELSEFKSGFYSSISPSTISIFNADEFSLLLNGVSNIDVDDWRRNTEYVGWTANSSVIQWFWKTVRSLKTEEKSLLLKFATGSPCVPAGGFSHLMGLNGPTLFTIGRMNGEDNKLPSASTCFNKLSLPQYKSEDFLKDKLLIAIRHGCEGFAFC